jgi:GABA permease
VTQASLAHTLKTRHVTMISLGGIIGAGIFVGSSVALHMAGPAVMLTYALCGGLVFLIMRMLGEMALARPGVGSFSGYAVLGLGPWAGFVTGWLYFYFWVITIAVEAIAGAKLLDPWIHGPLWLVSSALVAVMTIVNLLSVRAYGEFEFWFALLKVFTILAFIAFGVGFIFFGPGLPQVLARLQSNGGFFPVGWPVVFTAIPVVIFSMMGSEVATIAAVETDDPGRNIVRASRTVTLRILFFYIGSVAVIAALLPWPSIEPGKSPFAATLALIHVPGAAQFMTLVVFTAVMSCLNSAIYVTSRMLFEMAQRGDAPEPLRHLSGQRVPAAGIMISSVCGFLVILSSILSPNGIFAFLVQSSGATILLIYMLIMLSQISLRRSLEAAGENLALKVWAFPGLSIVGVIGILAVLVLMAFTPDQLVQVALCIGVFVASVIAYFARRRWGPAL